MAEYVYSNTTPTVRMQRVNYPTGGIKTCFLYGWIESPIGSGQYEMNDEERVSIIPPGPNGTQGDWNEALAWCVTGIRPVDAKVAAAIAEKALKELDMDEIVKRLREWWTVMLTEFCRLINRRPEFAISTTPGARKHFLTSEEAWQYMLENTVTGRDADGKFFARSP